MKKTGKRLTRRRSGAGRHYHHNHNQMYAIRTKHGNRSVRAETFNVGSDGFVTAKNGTTTVASIPVGNVEGVFREGAL